MIFVLHNIPLCPSSLINLFLSFLYLLYQSSFIYILDERQPFYLFIVHKIKIWYNYFLSNFINSFFYFFFYISTIFCNSHLIDKIFLYYEILEIILLLHKTPLCPSCFSNLPLSLLYLFSQWKQTFYIFPLYFLQVS